MSIGLLLPRVSRLSRIVRNADLIDDARGVMSSISHRRAVRFRFKLRSTDNGRPRDDLQEPLCIEGSEGIFGLDDSNTPLIPNKRSR